MIRIRGPRVTIGAVMSLIAVVSMPIAREANRRSQEARAAEGRARVAEILKRLRHSMTPQQMAESEALIMKVMQERRRQMEHNAAQAGADDERNEEDLWMGRKVHVRNLLLDEIPRLRPL